MMTIDICVPLNLSVLRSIKAIIGPELIEFIMLLNFFAVIDRGFIGPHKIMLRRAPKIVRTALQSDHRN